MSYIEEIFVMKQISTNGNPRYRYRIAGEDFNHAYLNELEAFKFKYSTNMNLTDIAIVEMKWEGKLINEEHVC